jgi:hypothetical protein
MGTIDIKQWLVLEEKKEVLLIKDIAEHGCEGGVTGLIYYWETTKFHDEHEDEIWSIVSRFAVDSGQTIMQYIAVVAKDAGDLKQLKNNLVWLAVESVAQDLDEERQAPAAGKAACS